MIIDAHQHVYYHNLTPKGVIAEMDTFGIDVTWLLTWYLPPSEDVRSTHGAFNPLIRLMCGGCTHEINQDPPIYLG